MARRSAPAFGRWDFAERSGGQNVLGSRTPALEIGWDGVPGARRRRGRQRSRALAARTSNRKQGAGGPVPRLREARGRQT